MVLKQPDAARPTWQEQNVDARPEWLHTVDPCSAHTHTCHLEICKMLPTCFPSSVYSFFTAPESSLMASVMSASTCSNEWAVFLFSSTLTALRGFTPLRITVTSLGLIKSLLSFPSPGARWPPPEPWRPIPATAPVPASREPQLGFTFLV